jgi:hypothetical protein
MSIKPIAYSYWRSIKRGNRTFDSIPNESVKEDVRTLAKMDVEANVITIDDYKNYIGEDCVIEETAEPEVE